MIVVGLGHQAQVGKDTAAQILVANYGFKRLAFADTLKNLAYHSNPIMRDPFGGQPLSEQVDYYGWEKAKEDPEVRGYLQRLGVAAREVLGKNVWVRPVIDRIMASNGASRWVISDLRFHNEAEALLEIGAELIKITRPGVTSNAGSHESEIALANFGAWDHVIQNDGTLEDLERNLVSAIGLD